MRKKMVEVEWMDWNKKAQFRVILNWAFKSMVAALPELVALM